jgi:hypothetical protein
VLKVQEILQQMNIIVTQMVDNPADHCQEVVEAAGITYLQRGSLPVLNVQADVNILGL